MATRSFSGGRGFSRGSSGGKETWGLWPVSDVLAVIAAACFVDAFIIFVLVSVLLSDTQGQFELRWPWSPQPRRSSNFGHFEQTTRPVRAVEPLAVHTLRGAPRLQSGPATTWQETRGLGWTPKATSPISETKHFAMGRVGHKWTKHQWVLSRSYQTGANTVD